MDSALFVIQLLDVNEPPILDGPFLFKIEENSPAGTAIGHPLNKNVTDPDVGDTRTFVMTYPEGFIHRPFAISTQTGQIFISDASVNYEFINEYNVTVRISDKGGLFDEEKVTIRVIDLPEAPIFEPITQPSIDENAPAGTSMQAFDQNVTLVASDDDGDALTFSIVSCLPALRFSISRIDDESALVVSTEPLNFEVVSSYSITVSVTDGTFVIYKSFIINVRS